MKLNRNLLILFITLVIMLIGFGIIIPLLPAYVTTFGGSGSALGFLMAIYSAMQFLFSPMWGGLSDRYGRKPILLIGVLGNGITMLLLGLSTELWMLFVARALAGVLSSATLPTAMAYIGDSTAEKDRSGGMGAIGAAMGLGMILGPGIGGMFATISLSAPFYFAAALSLLSMLTIHLFLPESLSAEQRKSDLRLQGPPLGEMWRALFGPLSFLFITAFMISFGITNFEGIFPYYTQERFGYTPQTIGLILTVVGVVSVIAQGLLTGPATRAFGDSNIIKASLIGSAVGFLLMLSAVTLPTILLTTAFFVLSNAMLRPATSSLISKRATSGQGIAMGLNNAYMSLGRVLGPIWAGNVIDINLSLPFLTGAAIMFIGFIAALIYLPRESPQPEPRAMSAD